MTSLMSNVNCLNNTLKKSYNNSPSSRLEEVVPNWFIAKLCLYGNGLKCNEIACGIIILDF